MENTLKIDEDIERIFKKFREHVKSDTVIGEPVEIGDITLVPIIDVSLMLGFKGENLDQGGAGLGGRVTTAAMLVIKDRDARLLPVKDDTDLERLKDLVQDIVEEIRGRKKTED